MWKIREKKKCRETPPTEAGARKKEEISYEPSLTFETRSAETLYRNI